MHVAITGCASGIGAAVVERLRARGDRITAFDRTVPDGVDRFVPVDLADPASIDAAARAVAHERFDALVNNAGVPPQPGVGPPGNGETVLRVNYLGLRRFTRAMLDRLEGGAAIVHTASRAGARWRDNLDQVRALMTLADDGDVAAFMADRRIDHVRAYNLSKEAVIAQTIADTPALRARGLRANTVSPAAISTGILDDFMSAFGPQVAANVARVGRPGEVGEVAELIVFLADPRSGWLRGQDIVIDGGMSALIGADELALPSSL